MRIRVTAAFKRFFEANPTGVFNGTDDAESFWHAVLLTGEHTAPARWHAYCLRAHAQMHLFCLQPWNTGYDNEGLYWYARNSWGSRWADDGTFRCACAQALLLPRAACMLTIASAWRMRRIAYGVLDVGNPEESFGLVCDTSSSDEAELARWSDRWPVKLDERVPDGSCWLYTAGPRDSISGIVDHFGVEILDFIGLNAARGVIRTDLVVDDAGVERPEPQLQGPWTGVVFTVCNISEAQFDRVASAPGELCMHR